MKHWMFSFLTAALLFFTVLPWSRKKTWWVRAVDFPRLQLAIGGLALLSAEGLMLDRSVGFSWVMMGATLACLVYQAWWILPYTRLHPVEVKSAAPAGASDRICILTANVLMTNRRVEDFLRIVRAERPDVLVTLETNAWWERQFDRLLEGYPHALKCPLENFYGMHLYSRFPLEDAKIQFLVEPDVPSMHTLVVLPSQRRVRLHCLHPAPPSPTENPTSRERDAELVLVGRTVPRARFPVIVSGDLNDVAWSDTTRLFRKLSRLLDPRIGRGMYNTFHAAHPLIRWPVDHFFHSKEFTLVRLRRLGQFGSDHFPVLIELGLEEKHSARQEGLEPDADTTEEARENLASVAARTVHQPGE